MADPVNYSYNSIVRWAKNLDGITNDITAKTAATLATPRTLTIKDSSNTNAGSAVSFNGGSNIVLNLPATIEANITGGSTNIRVTDTDSNIWYPLVFSSGSAANTNYAARVDSDSILVNPGTSPAANTEGNCYLQLGNAKAKATAGNKMGRLRIYGNNTSYSEIISGVGTTARTITLPDKSGTVALTSDISASANPADYVKSLNKLCIKKIGSGTSTYSYDYWFYNVFEYVYNSGFKDLTIIIAHSNITGITATEVAAATKLTITFPVAFTANFHGFYNFRGGSTVGAHFSDYLLAKTFSNTAWGGGYSGAGQQGGFPGASSWPKITLTAFSLNESNMVCQGVRIWGY